MAGVLEFVIPSSRDELLEKQSSTQYYVQAELTEDEFKERIKECYEALENDGPIFILQNFDTLYSMFTHFKTVEYKVLHNVYTKLLLRSLKEFSSILDNFLSGDTLDEELQEKYLNVIKMTLWVFTEFIVNFETRLQKDYHKIVIDAKARKVKVRASIKHNEKLQWDWDYHLSNGLNSINQILKSKINKLWDPPVVEEEFVNIISNCCYKIIEDPCIASVKHKELRIFIFQIVGYLIKRYNHGISCTVKIVQLLKNCEHLVSPLAQAVVMFIRNHGCKSLVREIVREISAMEDGNENAGQDSSKMIAAFLNEVAAHGAEFVIPAMEELLLNLEKESYMMRNCTLTIVTELLINVYKKEDLSDEAKEQRDEYLSVLLDHMHDVHTFVRTKVLQLFQRLVLEKAIPVAFTLKLLERSIGRLMDKSSNVVKYTVQLLKIMIEANPYAAKLGVQELRTKVEEAKEKLKEMESHKTEDPVYLSLVEEWTSVHYPALASLLPSLFEEDKENNSVEHNSSQGQGSSSNTHDLYIQIKSLISQHKYEEAYKDTKKLQVMIMGAEGQRDVQQSTPEFQLEYSIGIMRQVFIEYKGTPEDEIRILTEGMKIVDNETHQNTIPYQTVLISFLEDSLGFAEKITECIPIMCQLMLGKSPAEQLEAIEFFRSAHQFGMADADVGVREMLALVKAKDKTVKDAVIRAYSAMYLQTDHRTPRGHSVEVIKRLCNLVRSIDAYQKSTVEELIKEWVTVGAIDRECIIVLWEMFTRKLDNTSDDDSKVALILISMVAGAQVMTVKSNIDVLIDLGLGEQNGVDCQMVAYVCQVFLKLEQDGTRYPNENRICSRLMEILMQNFAITHDQYYPVMAVEAINVIYKLAKSPDQLCSELLKNVYSQVKMREEPENEIQSQPLSQPLSQQSTKGHMGRVNEDLLTHFLAILGHIAIRQMNYLDRDVLLELKRRNANEVKTKSSKTTGRQSSVKGTPRSVSGTSTPVSVASSAASSDDSIMQNQDVQNSLLVKDEASSELVRSTCDSQLLQANLLSHFTHTLIFVCQNLRKYSSNRLKSVASLTFSKLMFISLPFCDKHLQLFVTVMEKSPDPIVRINLLIGFGDLICRFPNLVEPWTSYLFNILKDEDDSVRLNALLTVSKLISNEMVKVKAYVSEVARLIVDKEESIAQRAVDLFEEISQKGSSLYNVFMDIVLRLSTDIDPIEEAHFQTILRIIINLINANNKEKNFENLVEKILTRLKNSEFERQWRDITFCLTQFNYNEASLNKILDNFDIFKEKFRDPLVMKNMMDIATGGNYRLAKPAMKELQNELKNRIDEATNHCAVPSSSSSGRDNMEVDNEQGDGEDGMITSTPAHSTRGGLRRPTETPVRAPQSTLKGRGRRRSEEREEAGGRGGKKPAKSQGKSSRRKKAASSSDEEMPVIEEDEDTEEEQEQEEEPEQEVEPE
uniref:Condensin complex subunit 1 n=2 Tax=Cacopsylla melanoneura TaxID=428564 RepID=A0A8D8QD33_9HEMI